MLRYAMAAAGGSIRQEGTILAGKSDVEELLPLVCNFKGIHTALDFPGKCLLEFQSVGFDKERFFLKPQKKGFSCGIQYGFYLLFICHTDKLSIAIGGGLL